MSPDEARRLLAVASNLKVRALLSLGYGCGLRAGEVVRVRLIFEVKHVDGAQNGVLREVPPPARTLSWRKRYR
jgi:integrase/recombinase XerD